jgi:D-lactate dehydrogenase
MFGITSEQENAFAFKLLKSGRLKARGLDVYEEEEEIFFQDFSGKILQDDILARLITFPNVIITSHQAFLTGEALANIAETTCNNIRSFMIEHKLINQVGEI